MTMGRIRGGPAHPWTMGLAEMEAAGRMDARTLGRMLQMRGEILRAVGEIMQKHGEALAEQK
jgi:hypothetical protein